jgi:predicted ABC-type sugar transport system permease subunit
MAKEFDNSLERFARPDTGVGYYLAAAAAMLLLGAVLVAGIVSQNWLVVGVAALATLAVAVLLSTASRGQHILASKAATWISWEPAEPDIQRQTLNVAVNELSRILQVQPEAVGDLQTAFIVGADLALRQIQQDENVPVMRHVSVGGVPFDAVLTKDDVVVCCEVSFLVSPELRQDRIVSMMRKIGAVKKSIAEMNIGMQVRLMVVLVTQMSAADVEKLRETLSTKRFTATPVDIDIRLMDFAGLQKTYVTD